MRVLVACEFSGIVREAFKARGHDAMSCDLLPTEIPGYHWTGDIFECLSFYHYKFDLMIAHPPCTNLAVSGAAHFHRKKEAQERDLEFVRLLMNERIEKICIENPVSIISTRIRKPDQIIHPYYFGDTIPKKTCLWLKNLPKLVYSLEDTLIDKKTSGEPEFIEYNSAKTKSGKSKYSIYGKLGKGHGHERSVTSKYLAQAMATQWT